MRRLLITILILVLSTPLFGFIGGNVKELKEVGLSAELLPNGDVKIKSPKIEIVVSPRNGGRVMSAIDLTTKQQMVETFNENDPKTGGAFYDILDFLWPGSAERQYSLENWGISTKDKTAFVEVSYTVGDESDKAKGLRVRKLFKVNAIDPRIEATVTVENVSWVEKKFSYWHQTRPILGDVSNTNKTIYLDIQGEASSISFEPGSGGRGDILTEGNYFGFVSKFASNSLLIVVDPNSVSKFWTWHDVKLPTFDIIFKEVTLPQGAKRTYSIDWAILPQLPFISYADKNTGLVVGLDVYDISASKATVDFFVSAYKSEILEKMERVYVVFTFEDSLGKVISTLSETNVFTILPYSIDRKTLKVNLPSVRGGYYYVRASVFDNSGNLLFSTRKALKIGEIAIPKFDRTLRVAFIWTLHQPLWDDPKQIKQNISSFLPIYSKIVELYSKRNTPVSINLTGSLLYQLAYYYPKQLRDFKELFKRNNVELLLSSFSYALLPFLNDEEIYRNIMLDKEFKDNYLGVQNIRGVWLPEMAFSDKVIFPISRTGATWIAIADLAVESGYRGLEVDYNIPYRLLTKAGTLNAVIVDTKASRILYRKTDRAIDEFIQYLISINEKAKDNKIVVVADNGESIGDGVFMNKLFDALEKIPWIKIVKVSDIFREVPPIKDLLAEKITGSWYYDPEEKKSSFRLWFDSKIKREMWDLCDETAKDVIKVMANFKQAEDVGVDTSYPAFLYENAWRHLIIARDSGWIWMGSQVGIDRIKSELSKSKYYLKDLYEALLNSIRGNIPKNAPRFTEGARQVSVAEFENIKSSAKDKVLTVESFVVKPKVPSRTSFVSVKVIIGDIYEFIDFSKAKAIFSINGQPQYYEKPVNLEYNGEVLVNLGISPTDRALVEIYFLFESFSKKKQIVGPFTFEVK